MVGRAGLHLRSVKCQFSKEWAQVGQRLPATVRYVEVAWADGGRDATDAEAATTIVPTCALWAPTGLTVLPPRHRAALSAASAVHSVAGVLQRSAFWGDKAVDVQIRTKIDPDQQQPQQQQKLAALHDRLAYTGQWQSAQAL